MERDRFNQQEISELNDFVGATRGSLLGKLTEEIREFFGAERFSPEMYKECSDIIIICVGIMAQGGLNVSEEVDGKMKIAWEKYKEVPRLRELGMKHGEAMQLVRKGWEGK